MTNKQISYAHLAETILKNIKKRGFTGVYAPTVEDAQAQLRELLKPGMTVANGGSETLGEIEFRRLVDEAGCEYIDRQAQNRREAYAKAVLSDLFFMSSNAITVEGELVNIDASGNRIACLAHGPEKVVLVIGMNKVCRDVPSAINRIKVQAAPPNCVRLGRKTPCAVTGTCGDCHSEGCICCNTIVTRHSPIPGRIHLILVGEELGY